MQLGFGVPVSGAWATPDNATAIAVRAEELGYASLWTFQRLLYPADTGGDTRWAPSYRSVEDPLVTLAFLAGRTSRIRLGVAVLNAPFYAPLVLAKALTTLNRGSGGRLDVGLGLGWAEEEYAAAGAPYAARGRRLEEFLACLEAVWTQDPVEFRGEFHAVPRSHVDPKPAQRPRPPLLLGGSAEPALRRAGRLADGWISGSGQDLRAIAAAVEVVRRAASEAGRDPEALRFVCRGVVRLRPGGREHRRPLTGSLEEIRTDLDVLADSGVTEVFADLNFDPRVGAPDADPDEAMRSAHEVLEALAPAPR